MEDVRTKRKLEDDVKQVMLNTTLEKLVYAEGLSEAVCNAINDAPLPSEFSFLHPCACLLREILGEFIPTLEAVMD